MRNEWMQPSIKEKWRYRVFFGKAFNQILLHGLSRPRSFFKVCLFLFLLLRAWLWLRGPGRTCNSPNSTSETVVGVSRVPAFLVCLDHTKANRFLAGGDSLSILCCL